MKKLLALITLIALFFMQNVSVSAQDFTNISAPTGFQAVLVVIPIIVILVLLFMRVDMLVAGLIGGLLAMVIGGISLTRANEILLTSIPSMLGITVPIINSAVATAVFKAGGYASALALVRRKIGDRVELLSLFIVFLMSLATYMSGIGGGTAMVLAPLAFAAVGAVPEVIAAMCIAAAVSFTTSPASLESSIISQLTGVDTSVYVGTMRWLWIGFTLLAMGIAYVGTKRRGVLFQGEESEEIKQMTPRELWKQTIPVLFFLFAVLAGPYINQFVGFPLLGPLVYMVVTIGLIALCTDFTIDQASQALVEGAHYILTRLFQVGIFITFINIISETGAFSVIVGLAEHAPSSLLLPALILAGFAIGVPAGAYVATILTLVLPVGISLGLPLIGIGLITMAVGFGSQLAFVNITMQAQAAGFQQDILTIVRGNAKWIISCLVILLGLSLFI